MSTGFFDIHAHIIPRLDDGAFSMEETMKILEKEYNDGVRTIFATTHFRKGMFEPELTDYEIGLRNVREAAAAVWDDLVILPGCEFHANMDMIEVLDKKLRPTMAGGRCVLTEFFNGSDRAFIKERCYSLMSHGYKPIIAHAERYEAFRRHFDFLEEMVDMGAYIQMNAQSIIGDDGFGMKQFCKKALKHGLVHFVATDAHNMRSRKPRLGAAAAVLTKLIGREGMKEILIENPQSIILGI